MTEPTSLFLLDSLQAYRRLDTLAWAGYARKLSEAVGSWAADCLESTRAVDVAPNYWSDGNGIADELLSVLLDPEFVAHLHGPDYPDEKADLKTEARISADLTEHLTNYLALKYLSTEDPGAAVEQDWTDIWYKLDVIGPKIR